MTGQRMSSGPAKPETRERRQPNEPQVGWFAFRHIKSGPRVGARIVRFCCCTVNGGERNEEHEHRNDCDRFPCLVCEVDGVRYDAPTDAAKVPMIERVWLYGKKITEAEFKYLLADRAWVREHEPAAPEANPSKPVNLSELDPIF
jgi:hypothetical protein